MATVNISNIANVRDGYSQTEFERFRAQDQIDNKIYSTAWGILGNAADVEDAYQDTLVKAWEHFAEFSLSSKLDFGAWVGRIARNICFHVK